MRERAKEGDLLPFSYWQEQKKLLLWRKKTGTCESRQLISGQRWKLWLKGSEEKKRKLGTMRIDVWVSL